MHQKRQFKSGWRACNRIIAASTIIVSLEFRFGRTRDLLDSVSEDNRNLRESVCTLRAQYDQEPAHLFYEPNGLQVRLSSFSNRDDAP